ncbi:MAG: glycosyltransferase 87 family protein [Actinomycetales bacterium]
MAIAAKTTGTWRGLSSAATASISIAAVALSVVLLFVLVHPGNIDFDVYRYGGRTLLDHWGGNVLYAARNGLPFTYPPFAALLFTVSAVIPLAVGYAAVALCTLAGSAVVGANLARHRLRLGSWRECFADGRFRLIAAAATVAIMWLGPWRDTLDFGQINVILMGMVLFDIAAGDTRKGRRWPTGLLTGLAAGIKLTPLAMGLLFLVRRDFKAILWLGVGFAGSVGLGFLLLPAESRTFWLDVLPNTSRIGGPGYVDNLSLKGMLLHTGFTQDNVTIPWVLACLVTIVVGAMAIKWASDGKANLAAVSIAAIVTLLISPVSWSHHWVWMAVALTALAFSLWDTPRLGAGVRRTGWTLLAVTVVVQYLSPKTLAALTGSPDPSHVSPVSLLVASVGVPLAFAMILLWGWIYRPERLRRTRRG